MSTRNELLLNILKELEKSSRGQVEASAIISTQGLPISSLNLGNVDEGVVAAMAAAILAVSERATAELDRGQFNRVLVEGENGYIIIAGAGSEAILVVLANKKANLGYIFLIMTRLSTEIEKTLRE